MRKIATFALVVLLLGSNGAWAETIQWSGYEWVVKTSKEPFGPGPNLWSNAKDSVWVDGQGRLNLKLRRIGQRWHCAEVYSVQSLGYGKYIYYLDARVDNLDPNVVAGMFIHADDMHEIDIEFSKWGENRKYTYHQFVLQPRVEDTNIKRSDYRDRNPLSTHSFDWTPEGVAFRSYVGHEIENKLPHKSWDYTGPSAPTPGAEKVHINLWLYKGQPPLDDHETILVIDKFVFIPHKDSNQEKDVFLITPNDPKPANVLENP